MTDYDHLQESFSRHVIKSETHSDDLSSWLMKRYEEGGYSSAGGYTSVFWCRVTVNEGMLTVVGDFDPVVFQGYSGGPPEAVVAWMGGRARVCSYVMQKASIGTGREAVIALNVDDAHDDLRELIASNEQEIAEGVGEDGEEDEYADNLRKENASFQAGIDVYVDNYSTCMPYAAAAITDICEAVHDHDRSIQIESEVLSSVGERPAMRVVLAHLAVQQLHKLLEARGPRWCPGDRIKSIANGQLDDRLYRVLHVLDKNTALIELEAVHESTSALPDSFETVRYWRAPWPAELGAQVCDVGTDNEVRAGRLWQRATTLDIEGAKDKLPYVARAQGDPL